MPETVALDTTLWSLALMTLLGIVGFKRGVRAEGITLAGIIATTVIFTNEGMRERLAGILNKLPKVINVLIGPEDTTIVLSTDGGNSVLLGTADQRLLFYFLFFVAGVIIFYLAGQTFSGGSNSMIQRLASLTLGALNGYFISLALTNFGQNYLSRHPNPVQTRFQLPTLTSPALPGGNSLMQYTQLVFLLAFFTVAVLAVVSIIKARHE